MKRRSILLAVCMLLMSVTLAQALPQYTITGSPGRIGTDGGGPFVVNSNFQTFCLEASEYITLGNSYYGSIDSVVYYSSGALGTSAPVNANTAILYNYFLDHQSTLSASDKDDIQLAIWMYQGQRAVAANQWYTDAPTLNATNREIMVLNLWGVDVGDGPYLNDQNAFDNKKQSLLIVTPEPMTLILFGIGLIALAGVRREE